MRFGVREICDVAFRAKSKMTLGGRTFYKNEPVIYFDSLKTSSLEGASTTVYATGGHGNTRLIAWEGERTLTFNMEDALISPESLAILSGAGLAKAAENNPVYVHMTSQGKVATKNTIVIPEIACWNGVATGTPGTGTAADYKHANADIFCMVLSDSGTVDVEPCVPAAVVYGDGKTTITCYADGAAGHKDLEVGKVVLVDYYIKKVSNTILIEITPEIKGQNFYIEASTLFRDENTGLDMPAEFVIPNGKVQSNFTFSMASSGDPSTFSFVVDAFPGYTKFDLSKKVLAAIQVVMDDVAASEESRKPCTAVGGINTPEGHDAELKNTEPVRTQSAAKRLSFVEDEDEDLI